MEALAQQALQGAVMSRVCPVGRRPAVHGAETALFAEGQPGSDSTRSRKLSRTPGLGGCPALGSH